MLPQFRYHPDPVGSGSFEPSTGVCPYCEEARGYVYRGPVYTIDEPDPPCPECVADGSFARRFQAEFTDPHPLADLEPPVIDEVTHRTPGFSGWQQERWLTHCGDAAQFLGPAGFAELQARPEALASVRLELESLSGWASADLIDGYLRAMTRHESPTAYLFRCLHCAAEIGYSDDI